MKVWFQVTGVPGPQGSKRGFPGKNGGVVIVEGGSKASREKVATWRQDVIDACKRYVDTWEEQSEDGRGSWRPLSAPVALHVEFVVHRPKTVPKHRRGWPAVAPDGLKLGRATEDALKLGRVFLDDGQVCQHVLTKRYAGPDGWTGATILVEELEQA